MPNIRPSTLLLQIAIMELLQDAEAFGISKPLIMAGLKQIGQGMTGTALSQIPDTGLKQSLV